MGFFGSKSNKKKERQVGLYGRNIYLDKKNRYIYWNRFDKNGYLIPLDKVPSFRLYQMRWFLSIATVVILNEFFFDGLVIPSALGGIVVFVFSEYNYRKKFLPNLTRYANFKPDGCMNHIEIMATVETKKLYMLTVLYCVLAILLVLLGITENYSPVLMGIILVIAAYALYICSIHIRAILFKRK